MGIHFFGQWWENSAEVSRLAAEIAQMRRNYCYYEGLVSEKAKLLEKKKALQVKWTLDYVPALRLKEEFEDELDFSLTRPQEYLHCMMEQLNVVELSVLKKLANVTTPPFLPNLNVSPYMANDLATPEILSPDIQFPKFPVSASLLSPSITASRLQELRALVKQLLKEKQAISSNTCVLVHECNRLHKEIGVLRANMAYPPISLYEPAKRAMEARRKAIIRHIFAIRAQSYLSEASTSNMSLGCSTARSSVESGMALK